MPQMGYSYLQFRHSHSAAEWALLNFLLFEDLVCSVQLGRTRTGGHTSRSGSKHGEALHIVVAVVDPVISSLRLEVYLNLFPHKHEQTFPAKLPRSFCQPSVSFRSARPLALAIAHCSTRLAKRETKPTLKSGDFCCFRHKIWYPAANMKVMVSHKRWPLE